ncbi:MAG: PQQ-dependent sugar dehydrogenase, partial [Planctomycetales bacterium]|nr:PQQ-dependent sugar dehydrogenase [Planctomycetales bacterium]
MLRKHLRHRRTRFEHLEPRELLAGDTWLVNFQNDEATTPTRYLRDTGLVFGARGGGLSYGWSSDHTDQARERSLVADQRFDTLIHIEQNQNWEFQLPAGDYEVTVAVGDPSNNDGIHTINVEGVNFFNAVPDGATPLVHTATVTVTDGRLTLDQGAAADKSTRIDFVHIVGVAPLGNTPPDVPTITEPAVVGQVVNPADVHMEAVGFSDLDGDTHKSSDWEIWTTGIGAEPVWQTLGIESVERLHTHLGDGIFINALAGDSELAANTDYELRVRFRDSAGAVSGYATRQFHTGAASTSFPMQIQDVSDAPAPDWVNEVGSPIELPAGQPLLSPQDAIIAIDRDGNSSYPQNESPDLAIDGTLAKYLNFGEVNSGFIVTPAAGATTVTSFQITTANDAEERDPTAWALYGTNAAIASTDDSTGGAESWTLIDSGAVALPLARDATGPVVTVNNSTAYTSYRMVITGVRNQSAANSMPFAEIQFYGEANGAVAPSLRIEAGDTGDTLLQIEGDELPGNLVTNPAALDDHHFIRVVIQANSHYLSLGRSDLSFEGDDQPRTIYLPAINLAPGERLDLWVDSAGSTYLGQAGQTEPDFTTLARGAVLDVPFIANRAGFVIEEVGTDYRLPVNIAFVPDPGPNPDDPLYFVTELYGSIQVVTRDGTKHEFATGLLDYNPQGPISGSGEQGLTGLAVIRDEIDPEVYQLFVGMLADNGSPPGGAAHYPKVERLTSVAGGLAMATRTVLLNMQPETQGQSHQISNISIGPDGKLYVHNGDGFDASTALNLNQYRGKILRMNLDGSAPSDNPFYNASDGITPRDFVYAYGFRNPFGGAWRASDGQHYEVENGPSVDRLARVLPGVSYGWNGSNASMQINAIYNWSPATAPVNIAFIQPETFGGSQFPADMQDHAFVSESGPTYATGPQANGKRISEFVIDQNANLLSGPDSLIEYVGEGKASVVGLTAGPDGLYFTELYEDTGDGGPTGAGARIYRVRYV